MAPLDDNPQFDPPPDVQAAVLQRYGPHCPACGSVLGRLPEINQDELFGERPALCLEVASGRTVSGTATRGKAWRLSVVGDSDLSLRSYDPEFHPQRVEYVYVLCGSGHIFPFSTAMDREPQFYQAHYWNTVASVGPVASGKTYLVMRMLRQRLTHVGTYPDGHREAPVSVRSYAGLPLEEYAFKYRLNQYDDTLTSGRPLNATLGDQLWPRIVLNNRLDPDFYMAVTELLQETTDPIMVDEASWGSSPAQPIMLRTRLGDEPGARHGWSCVVDLHGEFFNDSLDDENAASPRQRAALRGYDALVWTIDPLLEATTFDDFASSRETKNEDAEEYQRLLRGSLRPGFGTDAATTRGIRFERRQTQERIAERITQLGNDFVAEHHDRKRLLIVVSKVDLIRYILSGQTKLSKLGKEREFTSGIMHYLDYAAQNVGSTFHPEPACAHLLERLDIRWIEKAAHERRLSEIADALLRFYSDADRFWNLVEVGAAADIPLGPQVPGEPYYQGTRLHVPSISEHLRRALQVGPPDAQGRHGTGDPLLVRDLVMSSLAAGMVFALGYGAEVTELMRMPWVDVRLFLCSPLAAVPKETDDKTMETITGTHEFADSRQRSAAHTQLLLRVLRGVL